MGMLMLLLTSFLIPFSILASESISEKQPLYFGLILLLETGLVGTFTALNFFHWFIFWELSLVPAFFLIKFWGGVHRTFAATQFFIYTMVGSIALLIGFLSLYFIAGSFDFPALAEASREGRLLAGLSVKVGWYDVSPQNITRLVFFCVLLGFAVKIPIIPFHTWLPVTYIEAPTPVTMLLTGAMSKMGLYGLLRIVLPIFPDQMRSSLNWLIGLALLTIVYSAFVALGQKDLKKVFAYSSINHLGYCVLSIFAIVKFFPHPHAIAIEKEAALNGALLQMFNHGLTASALFCLLGFLERRSGGLRGVDDFGGLRQIAPQFCGIMGLCVFSSLGLPGLNGFISEFLIFKGAFSLAAGATGIASLGLLITAVFLLNLFGKVFNGPLAKRWEKMPDLTSSERVAIIPAAALIIILGIYPQLLIHLFNGTVMQMVHNLSS